MKKESGVTLMSLLIYIIIMMIVIGVMSVIIDDFYSNSTNMNSGVNELVNYNKFNTYFLKEVKRYANKVDTISNEDGNSYILFSSGNSFSFINNKIYYNDIEICKYVKAISFECVKEENLERLPENEYSSIIKVNLSFENFTRTINYKLENIY